jgi:Bacterial PH domain
VSNQRPTATSTERYRLPVRPPLRLLLLASMSATVGSLEVIAWSVFGLPRPVVQAGTALIVLGVGLAARAFVVHRRLGWVLYVGPDSLTVARGARHQVIPWTSISRVRLVGSRLVLDRRNGQRQHVLAIPEEALGSTMLAKLTDAIESHLAMAA